MGRRRIDWWVVLEIVEMALEGQRTVTIVQATGVSQPVVDQHKRALREAGQLSGPTGYLPQAVDAAPEIEPSGDSGQLDVPRETLTGERSPSNPARSVAARIIPGENEARIASNATTGIVIAPRRPEPAPRPISPMKQRAQRAPELPNVRSQDPRRRP